MLKADPALRPKIDEILNHPWLNCDETLKRVNRLYGSNIFMESGELEETLVNVTLNDTDCTILTPPPKRRRIDFN
jgi:hypothetical protein